MVIRGIPKEKYENIFKGAYNRDAVYVKNKTFFVGVINKLNIF